MPVSYVNKNGSVIDAGSNASYVVKGDDDAILLGDDSTLTAHGSGFVIDVFGTGDVVYVGANGGPLTGSVNGAVEFYAPGILHEPAYSRVQAIANYAKLTMTGDDALSVYGAGDNVFTAGGLDDQVSIGGNGANATGVNLDAVGGLEGGSLLVLADSVVWGSGDDFTATVVGHDTLTAKGASIQIYATGAGNTVTTGGNNQDSNDEDVVHMSGGVVNVLAHSSADILGDNLLVHAYGNDAVSLIGADDRLALGSFGNSVTIGQNGNPGGGLDIVQFAYAPLVEPVTVLAHSNVRIAGSDANVTLGGDDQVTLIGFHEQIIDTTGHNNIAIGGNGSVFFGQANNYVTLAAADTVTMLANSNLTLSSAGPVTNGQYAVHMSSKDALSIDMGMTVYAPVATGDDLLLNFGSTDVLQLASHFTSVNDLLAHTSEDYLGRTVVQLDAGTDTLTLGMDKTTFAGYAQEGLVQFH